MNELNDIAGQHEMIAENVVTQILTDLTQLIQSLRQDRKRVSSYISRIRPWSHKGFVFKVKCQWAGLEKLRFLKKFMGILKKLCKQVINTRGRP